MIQTKGLCYSYNYFQEETNTNEEQTALTNINLVIGKGEFVAILGHNGSGKSTLAKLFNALLLPTEGKIFVNGYDTSDENNIWLVRQSAGMVFQNPDNQMIATIVEEDVAFGPENLGIETAEIRKRVDEALLNVGMGEYADYSPHYLSGGQKQRVAIAGVLAMKPQLIILDEPTAMLDPIGRRDVMNTIIRLNREENITIVLITHYMDEAVRADRVVVMENGGIVMDDTPRNVFSQVEKMKELSLDVPQVTELWYKMNKSGYPIPEPVLTIEEMVDAVCQLR